ncbi:hypothetical protein FRC02_006271 [Tulasnella sp. 418]|nr:hypothetical protein FRC02_006271 [Tulasnella sp. 418]
MQNVSAAKTKTKGSKSKKKSGGLSLGALGPTASTVITVIIIVIAVVVLATILFFVWRSRREKQRAKADQEAPDTHEQSTTEKHENDSESVRETGRSLDYRASSGEHASTAQPNATNLGPSSFTPPDGPPPTMAMPAPTLAPPEKAN